MTVAKTEPYRAPRRSPGMRRSAFAAVLAIAAVLSPTPAGAAAAPADMVEEGKSIVRSLSSSVIDLFRQGSDRRAQEAAFLALFARHFDVPRIGRFVLGRAVWSKATAAERAQFLNLFQRYIAKVYTVQLRRYTGKKFEIIAAGPDRKGVVVTSRIFGTRSERPFSLKWRMRPSGSRLKVRDMVFENVSMSLNQRREFASVIRRRGGSLAGLLKAMREKMAELDRR